VDILLDLNVVLDLLLQRKFYNIAEKVYKLSRNNNFKLWMCASSVDNLYYSIHKEAKRLALEKGKEYSKENVDKIFKKFIEKINLFVPDPLVVKKAVFDEKIKDIEDFIICENFKRIAPEGIIITRDKYFLDNYYNTYSPWDFVQKFQDVLNKPRSIPILNLQEEYKHIIEEIDSALLKVVSKAKYILGPEVLELEQKIASYIGSKHAIGVSSGTDALVLSLRALAIKNRGEEYWNKEDLIITTPFTFTATGDAILRAGATPLFVDINPDTFNINPEQIKLALEKYRNVVGIIPVHLYGQPCDMDEIMEIARKTNIFVIEDCAQSIGAKWDGRQTGSSGDTGCFSFFPSKNLGGFGDGGMITTDDDELAEIISMLRKHGGKDKYNVDHIGYNARLDTLQAAVLLAKFKYLDNFNKRRREIAKNYNEQLKNIEWIKTPYEHPKAYHVYHQYTIRVLNRKRDELQKLLKEKGIQTMVYYPIPLHEMRVFVENGMKIVGDLKEVQKAVREVLSLPVEPLLGKEEIRSISNRVLNNSW